MLTVGAGAVLITCLNHVLAAKTAIADIAKTKSDIAAD